LRQSRERGDDVGGINRDIIITQAASNLVPAIYPYRFSATSGGLMSYGVGLAEQNREAASYVDRILKGEKPGNLPVQLPTQFDSWSISRPPGRSGSRCRRPWPQAPQR
jgi:putative ABC transport system substrate-binding protein